MTAPDWIARESARFLLGLADLGHLRLAALEADWPAALATAAREGVAPALAQALRDAAGLAPARRAGLDRIRWATLATNAALLGALEEVRQILAAHGQRAIILKGPALIADLYGDRLDLRPMSDLDLLVRPHAVPLLASSLLTRGWRPRGAVWTRGPLVLDLHTDLAWAADVRRCQRLIRLDQAWETATPWQGSTSLLQLDPVSQVLHLAVHGLKHGWSRLIWLVDLVLAARAAAPWRRRLLADAERAGAHRALAMGLAAAERLLGARPLDTPWRLSTIERWFVGAVARRAAPDGLGQAVAALALPSLPRRLAYLWELAFPRRAVRRRVYPQTRWPLAARALRVARLGGRALAALRPRKEVIPCPDSSAPSASSSACSAPPRSPAARAPMTPAAPGNT